MKSRIQAEILSGCSPRLSWAFAYDMKWDMTHRIESTITVAVVAPAALRDAYCVLLEAAAEVKVVACATTVQALLQMAVEQPLDLVLLDAERRDEQATEQVRRIKAAWPTARCIVLVEHARQEELVQKAGADVVLLKGIYPKRLLEIIKGGLKSENSTQSNKNV